MVNTLKRNITEPNPVIIAKITKRWTEMTFLVTSNSIAETDKSLSKLKAVEKYVASCPKSRVGFFSCCCDSCIHGDCDQRMNRDWVQPLEDVTVEQEGSGRRVTRGEIEQQQACFKGLITEGSIVAIHVASEDPGKDYYLLKVTGRGTEQLGTTGGLPSSRCGHHLRSLFCYPLIQKEEKDSLR